MESRILYFNEELHSYVDDRNIPYTSVTTLISKFDESFDEDFWSTAKAVEKLFVDKYGWTVWNEYKVQYGGYVELVKALLPKINKENLEKVKQSIKQEWDITRTTSCEHGTSIHAILENSINEATKYSKQEVVSNIGFVKLRTINDILLENCVNVTIEDLKKTEIYTKYRQVYNYIVAKLEQGYSLYAEVCVYDSKYLISGLIDLLLIKGAEFEILDWKTNKDELKFSAGYYKKENGVKTNIWVDKDETLKYPLNHLPKCKGSGYTLQLSMYAYLVEQFGLKCKSLVLCHIRNGITFYNIKYLKGEVKLMMVV